MQAMDRSKKPVILTGLRSNNNLHIGNYLGAVLPMIDMATHHAGEYQINFFVPDLHSFTTPIDHQTLYEQTMHNIRSYVAAGLPLDNDDIHIYRQSFIPAHSQLAWILGCFTYFGEMSRMTQFKDKANQLSESHISVGLFSYPILMAADILLYGASYVPVGDDQTQHLEFTRDIGRRINKKFGELFTLPVAVAKQHAFFGKDQGLRIRDLANPAKKMSKSDASGKGVLFLSDPPDVAAKKIMAATTDSLGKVAYDYQQQPGVSNLLDIYRLLGGEHQRFIGQSQYGPLKQAVADQVKQFISDFQARLAAVNIEHVERKLTKSESKMRQQADRKLSSVQQALGLRPPNS